MQKHNLLVEGIRQKPEELVWNAKIFRDFTKYLIKHFFVVTHQLLCKTRRLIRKLASVSENILHVIKYYML